VTAVNDQRKQRACQEERTLEIYLYELVEYLFGGVLDKSSLSNSGVVDKVVEIVSIPSFFNAREIWAAKSANEATLAESSFSPTALPSLFLTSATGV